MVVLPPPLGPTKATTSPALTSRFKPWKRKAPGDPGQWKRAVHGFGEGRLAAAARPHQGNHFAGFDFQVQALEAEAAGRSGIVEAGVLEDNVALKTGELRGAGRIHHGLPMVEVFEDLLRCAERLLEDVIDAHQ